jgi:hypothetical protein
MSQICRKLYPEAELGTYELACECSDSNVVLLGLHGVNGEEKDRWFNSDLVNRRQSFGVKAGERHQTIVAATFPEGDSKTEVKVRVLKDGQVLRECSLTQSGSTQSSISIITSKVSQ